MLHSIRELANRSRLRIHLVIEGILIGILVGGIVSMYRYSIRLVEERMRDYLHFASHTFSMAFVFVCFMACLGICAGFCFHVAPYISGSGIPQVSAQLAGTLKPRWQRILPFKLIGGILTLGSGLTMGREGPSVQVGASIGQGFGELFKRPTSEKRYLITGGASAGLAVAFNAPISGAVFALEELHKNFSPRALISAMVAAFSANYTSQLVFGQKPVLHFSNVPYLPLRHYLFILLIGVVTGLSGVLFNKAILFSKKLYKKCKLNWAISGSIPFIVVAVSCLFIPDLFGSGEHLIYLPTMGPSNPSYLVLLYVLKFLLLMICFGSGLPGGIFFPLLILGSLSGHVIAAVATQVTGLEPQYILALSLLSMAGHFASIVRAPLTGILLVAEMTGSFENMLPLGIVSLIAYLIAEAFKSEPIYESLQYLLPDERNVSDQSVITRTEDRTVMEFAIEDLSPVDGKRISAIQWPNGFIIVAVRRGSQEITPNGSTLLRAGDYIVGMFVKSDLANVSDQLRQLTKNPATVLF